MIFLRLSPDTGRVVLYRENHLASGSNDKGRQ